MKSLKINLLTGILFLLIPFAALAQSQVPDGTYPNTTDAAGKKQGAWKKLDDKGTCVYVGQFKDDKPYGLFQYFDTDGRIMTELTFVGNTGTIAYCKMISVSGKVMATGKYVNQLKDSTWNFFTDDGLKLSIENYKNGVKEGMSTTFFPGTDTIASAVNFVSGKEEGAYTEYYRDGMKKETATYLHGLLEGTATWYFDNGNINILGAYHNSVKNGKWTYYWVNPDTNKYEIRGTETYVNGVMKSGETVIPKDQFNQQVTDPQQDNYNGAVPNGGQ